MKNLRPVKTSQKTLSFGLSPPIVRGYGSNCILHDLRGCSVPNDLPPFKLLHSLSLKLNLMRRKLHPVEIFRCLSFFVLFFILLLAQSSVAQLKVVGKGLYDKNGERIIARGVENSIGINLSEDGWFIDEIAKTGANAIRILPNLSAGQLTLAQIDNLLLKGNPSVKYIFTSVISWNSFVVKL
jgi:hypothetical protein